MKRVQVTLPDRSYDVRIGPGLLPSVGELVRAVAPHERAALIADRNVADRYVPAVAGSLRSAGYELLSATLAPGEEQKNLDTVRHLYHRLLDARLDRRSPLIALGGGVVGDTAGFVAATYLRGVPFIQCPTTLLAMVDASVGGKVGVNTSHGKNLIGAFYQPSLVVADTETLETLPLRELQCGLAECVKQAIVRDADLFDWLEAHLEGILALDSETLVELVQRNVQIKSEVVTADEREAGLRAHLNFGHTFAHAIESTQSYDSRDGYRHGEAVALGMVAATRLAVTRGLCPETVLERLLTLSIRIGLPTSAQKLSSIDRLVDAMQMDKKLESGQLRLVLPQCIGEASIVSDTPQADLARCWESLLPGR